MSILYFILLLFFFGENNFITVISNSAIINWKEQEIVGSVK